MYFTAHISKDKTRRQSVSEHTEKVASYAFKYGKKAGLENTSAIQAAFHDLGKLCGDFDDYINDRNKMRRGEIDHITNSTILKYRFFPTIFSSFLI